MTDRPEVPLASLELLRQLTDRHVIDQLLATETMTRAEIAAATGISKPTVSESVRRLVDSGVFVETGTQPSGRAGRTGIYYGLGEDLGIALAVSAGPEGLVAEALDVRGTVLRRLERPTDSPTSAARLSPQLSDLVARTLHGLSRRIRATAVSVAGPVDRVSGRLVHLPHSPFLIDELDVRELLAPLTGATVTVDNDINWAAAAEYHSGVAAGLDDFCYLHLGRGFGGAVVRHGEIIHGATGLAGEPAHLVTYGPRGRAMRLVEVFGSLGLLQPGSEAIDVAAVTKSLRGRSATDRRVRGIVVDAVAGAAASMAALLNPAGIVIGGPWLEAEGFAELLVAAIAEAAIPPTAITVAELGGAAALTGARLAAVRTARESLFSPFVNELGGLSPS